jgi:alpha-beta hydrolase superfamily lysophospholipase
MLLTSLSVILGGPGCRSVRPAANPPVADADSLPSPPDVGWPARISNPPRRNPVDGRIPDHPDGIGVERADGSPITMEFVGLHPHGEVWAFGEDETGVNWIADIDPALIRSTRSFIVVTTAPTDDPPETLAVPRRRAIDAIVLTPAAQPPVGTAIVMSSLARQTPPEQAFMADLLEAGFTVITSAPPVNAIDERTGGRTTLDIADAPEIAGRLFAAEVDLAFAAWADGLDAILDASFVDVGTLPRPAVLIGVSSGAVAAPVVAARLHETMPIEAAVLIAGGADLDTILLETTLDPEDLRLTRRGPRPDATAAETFRRAYRTSVRLDDPSLTNWFALRPILLLEGGFDTAIPATARATMDERLGRPERWWYPTGHYGLFVLLPGEGDAIVRWIRRTLDLDGSS